jgi:hypothetical protein
MAVISGGTIIEGARYRGGTVDAAGASNVVVVTVAGVPVDGTSGTGAGVAGKGAFCVDTTNANLYLNANTLASPTWKLVTRAA